MYAFSQDRTNDSRSSIKDPTRILCFDLFSFCALISLGPFLPASRALAFRFQFFPD
jgi:hypothetical protein